MGIATGEAELRGADYFCAVLNRAATARGLGTCVQVSIAGYREIMHEQRNIPAEFSIRCGLAVGYADPDFPANNPRIPRNPIEKNAVFVET